MTEHNPSDPRCITHILANGITKLDSVCAKCRDEKLGGYR